MTTRSGRSAPSARGGAHGSVGDPVIRVLDAGPQTTVQDLGRPGHLRYARDFMSQRKVRQGTKSINRLYAIEAGVTQTGTVADHRIPVKSSQIEAVAHALQRILTDDLLARRLGNGGRKAVESLYNWDRVIKDLREIESQVSS